MEQEFYVSIKYDLVEGIMPVFDPVGTNGFDIGEWADIRGSLREEVMKDVPESEFEVYLNKNKIDEAGRLERWEYRIGTIVVSEDGEIITKDYDVSVDKLRESFKQIE